MLAVAKWGHDVCVWFSWWSSRMRVEIKLEDNLKGAFYHSEM